MITGHYEREAYFTFLNKGGNVNLFIDVSRCQQMLIYTVLHQNRSGIEQAFKVTHPSYQVTVSALY